MTHPLTPREKVELKPCPFCGGGASMHDGMGEFWVLCDDCGASGAMRSRQDRAERDWNDRSTALASGSGDHAELARLAEAASPGDWWSDDDVISHQEVAREDERFIYAMSPATVLALLAEIAALRGILDERDLEIAEDEALIRNLEAQNDAAEARATEAERKLAEAVQAIRDVDRAARQAASMNDAGYTVIVECTATHIYGITDTFLSKEAERG